MYKSGIFKQSMGAMNQVGTGLLNQPARLHRLAKLTPWNRFLGYLKALKFGLSSNLYGRVQGVDHDRFHV
jgi:hypothetical protein